MSAAELVDALLPVLEAEEKLYLELRDVLQEERVAILELDAARLELAVGHKTALVDEAQLLEESRREVTARLAAQLGLERPRLAALAEQVPQRGAELRDLHSRLGSLVAAVRELLDLNATLSGESLGQVRLTLELLGRIGNGPGLYDQSGTPHPAARGTLLRQAV